MFLELWNHGIWADILAYKRLQNTPSLRLRMFHCYITIILFNRKNHFHGLRFLVQKQIFVCKHEEFWNQLLCCFEFGSTIITAIHTWKRWNNTSNDFKWQVTNEIAVPRLKQNVKAAHLFKITWRWRH